MLIQTVSSSLIELNNIIKETDSKETHFVRNIKTGINVCLCIQANFPGVHVSQGDSDTDQISQSHVCHHILQIYVKGRDLCTCMSFHIFIFTIHVTVANVGGNSLCACV